MNEDKIRQRKSYQKFKDLLEFIQTNKNDDFAIIKKVHEVIDSYSGYHSATNSNYAFESITLLEKDLRVKA